MSVPDSCQAIVALGSNLGSSTELIERAMDVVAGLSSGPVLRSSLWRSSPVDCPPGSPDFVNAVIGITPGPAMTPEGLLAQLQAIETEMGRLPKTVVNEARLIDLDLVSYGDQTIRTEHLVLPHPRAHQRRFVLAPLAEILPDHRAPGWGAGAAALLDRLQADRAGSEVCKLILSS